MCVCARELHTHEPQEEETKLQTGFVSVITSTAALSFYSRWQCFCIFLFTCCCSSSSSSSPPPLPAVHVNNKRQTHTRQTVVCVCRLCCCLLFYLHSPLCFALFSSPSFLRLFYIFPSTFYVFTTNTTTAAAAISLYSSSSSKWLIFCALLCLYLPRSIPLSLSPRSLFFNFFFYL